MKKHLKSSHIVIKNADANGKAAIYVEISISGQQKRFPTAVKIKPSNYPTKANVKANDLRKILTGEDYAKVAHVESKIDTIISEWFIKQEPMSMAGIQREYDGDYALDKNKNVFDFYKDFLELKKNGNHNTYLTHSRTYDLLLEFSKKHKVYTFDDFTMTLFHKFRFFLEKCCSYKNPEGMSQATVKTRMEKLREFLSYYYIEKKHTNTIFTTYRFKTLKPPKGKFIVTLTLDELRAVRTYKFKEKRLERIRDYFVIQTMIGQRYVDFIRLDSTMYYVKDDKYYLCFLQQKTEKEVEFPLHQEAYEYFINHVVDSPSGKIRSITNSKYNNYLKDMLELVSKDCPSLKEQITKTLIIGTNKIPVTKFKYQWVTTHTARRTFINLALEAGVPVKTILSTTGHSKSDILDVYINNMQNQEEFLSRIKY